MNQDGQLRTLIGYDSYCRGYESFYLYLARLIRVNCLSEMEIRSLFPPSWLELAFAPDEASACLVDAVREAGPDPLPLTMPQAAALTWVPFPSIDHHAQERLRICAACLEQGYHTYAWQSELLSRCPLHGIPLTSKCGRCGAPLAWRSHSRYSDSALRCPRGCELTGQWIDGLFGPPRELNEVIARQLRWLADLASYVHFDIGPVYINYPPRQQFDGNDVANRPTPGLLASICDVASGIDRRVPVLLRIHENAHGAWLCRLTPWPPHADRAAAASDRQLLLRTIVRGGYTTEVPIFNFIDLLSRLEGIADEAAQRKHPVRMVQRHEVNLLSVPSYLLTNSEVGSLYQVLSSSASDQGVAMFYDCLLFELLYTAFCRRRAWDRGASTHVLRISERAYGVVRVGDRRYVLTAVTVANGDVTSYWNEFNEQSAVDFGTIFFTEGRALLP